MRVGLLFEYPTVNGGENSMLAVARHLMVDLENRFDDVELVGLAPDGSIADRLTELKVPHHRFSVFHDGQRRSRDDLASELSEVASTLQLDLIHANSLSMGRLLGAVSKTVQRPTSTHLRDIIKLSKAAIADLNRNSRLVAVSEATRQFHLGQGLDPRRTVTIHNGINADEFLLRGLPGGSNDSETLHAKTRSRVRTEFGIPESDRVFLSVGQIGLRKGLDTLADAFAQLACEIDSPETVHLLLVGERFSDKQESVEHEQAVLRTLRGLAPRLRLHATGYRSDIPRLMLAADCLVHAARQEPLGRVLLEASAVGLPVIATAVGGTREIFPSGEALLVQPDDVAGLAGEIRRVLADSELRKELAERARENVKTRFRVEDSAGKLILAWRNAVS